MGKRERVIVMERKILLVGIGIIVLLIVVLVPIGIWHDYGEAVFKWFSRTEVAETKTPEELEMKKTLEIEKLQKIRSLIFEEEFLEGLTIKGEVREIFQHTLIIKEEGQERFLVIPVSQEAKITSGEKKIDFGEIKTGDKVFILLDNLEAILWGGSPEGVYVDVSI